MSDTMWVLGATGRSGRGIARLLAESGHSVVLAGRAEAGLAGLAAELGGDVTVVSGSYESLLVQLRAAAPAVVVNTIGPFARTSVQVIEACPPGTHYVDIGNELPGIHAVLDGHARAVADGRTVVTGAGFGVLATESVVLRVCDGRPAPARVRVDAIPSLATHKGVIGSALAGSMLDGVPEGGRRVEHGRLVRSPLAAAREQLTTPAGDTVSTAALPTGDLLAAWRGSKAASVVAASSVIPSGPAVRVGVPGAFTADALIGPAPLCDRSARSHFHPRARAPEGVLLGTRPSRVGRRHQPRRLATTRRRPTVHRGRRR